MYSSQNCSLFQIRIASPMASHFTPMVVATNNWAQAFGLFVGYCTATIEYCAKDPEGAGTVRGVARATIIDIDFRIRTPSLRQDQSIPFGSKIDMCAANGHVCFTSIRANGDH